MDSVVLVAACLAFLVVGVAIGFDLARALARRTSAIPTVTAEQVAPDRTVTAEQVAPDRFKVTYPCGESELVEAEGPAALLAAIKAHIHRGEDA